jgi:peptide-methionine (R)-S-oxide reductase
MSNDDPTKRPPVQKTEAEWRSQLTPMQYKVLRERGTERAFTGKYWDHHAAGRYLCAGCGEALFSSDAKFDSGCGWPSFTAPITAGVVGYHWDESYGMVRVETVCAVCDAHLGHVFPDGPPPSRLRYCINALSLAKSHG